MFLKVVIKLSYNDSFSERLLENEMRFNDKLSGLIPEHHGRYYLSYVHKSQHVLNLRGRRWASFMGSCSLQIPKREIPSSLSVQRALVFKREQGHQHILRAVVYISLKH